MDIFEHHAELDFSSFKTRGRFLINFNNFQSPQFEISPAVYQSLPDQSLEFMRQQRCGYNPWVDALCHSFDGRTAYGPWPAGTYLDASGGWHDAGDMLKYLLTSSNATAQLLLGYELTQATSRPRIFKDRLDAWGLPCANGIPDLLDEARWGLDWMLRLHPEPNQLYHQVADDRDHRGWRLPQNETVDYGWGPGSYRVVYFADGKLALATQALLYERMTGDSRYREFESKQTDWLLGRNPWGTSMITGIPRNGVYPRDVHLFTVASLKRPVVGGIVDGPVYRRIFRSLKGVSITEPDPLGPFQDERAVYHDDIKDCASNEPTMDGTASAILLWALKAHR